MGNPRVNVEQLAAAAADIVIDKLRPELAALKAQLEELIRATLGPGIGRPGEGEATWPSERHGFMDRTNTDSNSDSSSSTDEDADTLSRLKTAAQQSRRATASGRASRARRATR